MCEQGSSSFVEKKESIVEKFVSVCYHQLFITVSILLFVLYGENIDSVLKRLVGIVEKEDGTLFAFAAYIIVVAGFLGMVLYFLFYANRVVDVLKIEISQGTNFRESMTPSVSFATVMALLNFASIISILYILPRAFTYSQEVVGNFFSVLTILCCSAIIASIIIFIFCKEANKQSRFLGGLYAFVIFCVILLFFAYIVSRQ